MSEHRYPGPRPFTDKDENLFFGRESEKEALINLIKTKGLSILFGRSGNGKSSLIHAALIPYFKAEQYKIVEIRLQPFKSYESDEFLLRKQIIAELKNNQNSGRIYLNEIIPESDETSLWQYFKTLQWEANNGGFEGVIFIIDQFEELFNFPIKQYKQFAKEFSEVIYNRIPYQFQEALNEKIKAGDSFITENKYQVDFIRSDFFSSFLIGIRSDRLYLLDELGGVIPGIFNNRFRLDHLDAAKVDDAITKPASLKGDFISPPFEIAPDVVAAIKEYLFEGSATAQMGYIETFQLQIICEFIEHKAIDVKKAMDKEGRLEPIMITKKNLNKAIGDIIKEYYENIIKSIALDYAGNVQALCIRYLIEKKLIDIKTNSRICLDKTSIYPIGINDRLLTGLTNSKIIRKEINTVSGESFEISHDSLVRPILEAANAKFLGNLEAQLYKYYSEKISSLNRIAKRDYERVLLKKLLNKEGNLSAFRIKGASNPDLNTEGHTVKEKMAAHSGTVSAPISLIEELKPSEKLMETINLLDQWDIIERIRDGKKGGDFYIINEAFRDAIVKKQNKDITAKQNAIKVGAVSLIILLVVVTYLDYLANRQHKIDRDNVFLSQHVSLFNPPTSGDLIDTNLARKKLVLLAGIYRNIERDTSSIAFSKRVFLDFFNSYDFLGKKISEPGLYPKSISNNSRNDLLVLYSNIKPSNSFGQQYGVYHAYLYNNKGVFLKRDTGVLDGGFGNNGEPIILKRDSLINLNDRGEHPLKFIGLALRSSNIVSANIDSIKRGISYCLFQVRNPSGFLQPLPVQIDSNGNVERLPGLGVYNSVFHARTKVLGEDTLRYTDQDSTLTLKMGGSKLRKKKLDFAIANSFFSSSGDKIFVDDGVYLTVLNKSLDKLAKYRNSLKSKSGPLVISNVIAYTQPGYVVLVNLNNSDIRSVNTLDPQSIIRYVNSRKRAKAWSLSDDEKRRLFNYHNP